MCEKFKKYYLSSAIIILNTIAFFLILNLFSLIIIRVFFDNGNLLEKPYYGVFKNLLTHQCLLKGYQNYSVGEVHEIIKENWMRLKQPHLSSGFIEAPYSGKYVNISKEGYRNICKQGEWPLDKDKFNIFVFGGSTTFGYGVTDCETIPSYLQDLLSAKNTNKDIRVYNFGTGGYASSHERLFFTDLLFRIDAKPDLIIFIDGLNDFFYDSYDIQNLSQKVSQASIVLTIQKLPVIRLKNIILNTQKFKSEKSADDTALNNSCDGVNKIKPTTLEDKHLVSGAVSNAELYVKNKQTIEAIAKVFNIKTLFIWQPIPTYQYRGVYYFSDLEIMSLKELQRGIGYEFMNKYRNDGILGENFLWLAHPKGIDDINCYIDKTHYTPDCAKLIANEISNHIMVKKLTYKK